MRYELFGKGRGKLIDLQWQLSQIGGINSLLLGAQETYFKDGEVVAFVKRPKLRPKIYVSKSRFYFNIIKSNSIERKVQN